jgi:serine/threonine protein kinase
LLPTGTPDYVAPEVLRIAEDALVEAAHSDADETNGTIRQSEAAGYGCEVDWWSLGATLYEMSAGRAPFFSPSIGSTYDRIMRCDVRMPNDLSPQLKSLLSG